MNRVTNTRISAPQGSAVPPDGTGAWWLPWTGAQTLATAAARLGQHGHVVILAHADARALPPPLPEEMAAAQASAHPQGYLVRRGIARALAARVLGGAPQDHPITQDSAGAPRITAGLHVSFSARGAVGVIALGISPLGVDYEPALPPAGIPWNILRPDERAALAALAPGEQAAAFLTLWCAKEAALKAVGRGFSLAPEAVRIEGDFAQIEAHFQRFRLVRDLEAGLVLALPEA